MTLSVPNDSGAPAPLWRRALDWWLAQVKHVLPPTIFFFFGFNLILFTRWMTLQEHGIPYNDFFGATLAALLVGKAVLVVDNLRFVRRFDGAPLIQPILVARFSWPRFLAIQVWLMVLFLVYVTAHELNTLFGDGELPRLFLRWNSTEAKLTRRQRIRLLTQLNRLTEANTVEVISEKSSPAHTELIGILRQLATQPGEKHP